MTSENVPTLYNLPIKLLCEDSQQIKTEIPIQEVTFSDSASQAYLSSLVLGFLWGGYPLRFRFRFFIHQVLQQGKCLESGKHTNISKQQH